MDAQTHYTVDRPTVRFGIRFFTRCEDNCSTRSLYSSFERVNESFSHAPTHLAFSNLGPCIDLFAPGDRITSAWRNSDFDRAVLWAGVAARVLQRSEAEMRVC